MKSRMFAVISALSILAMTAASNAADGPDGWLDIPVPKDRPAVTDESIAHGKRIYNFRCSPCHGPQGDGNGPVAEFLDPRPRDFTVPNFKFRTTRQGELPLDEDLYRTITRGLPGAAMPSWAPLAAEDRWKVIAYIKTFASDFFFDPALDPKREEDGKTFVFDIGAPPKITPDLIAEGKRLYEKEGKCLECHGAAGRGNGTSAGNQFTAARHRVWPRNLTVGPEYRGGATGRDIYRAITTGLNGSPMPSSLGALDTDPIEDERKRWAIAAYVSELVEWPSEESILRAARIAGDLPPGPDDRRWGDARELRIPLSGQATFRPRLQNPAVRFVKIRALHNEAEIAFRIEYSDRTESRLHEDTPASADTSPWPALDVTRFDHTQQKFRDAVALEFPRAAPKGPERPYFLYGDRTHPVYLMQYDAAADKAWELNAKGFDKIAPQPDDEQAITSSARFDDGRWLITMRRKLTGGKNDSRFEPGDAVSFAVFVWDGGNGEAQLRHAISSWHDLVLEAPVPPKVYGYAAFCAVAVACAEWRLLKAAGRKKGGEA